MRLRSELLRMFSIMNNTSFTMSIFHLCVIYMYIWIAHTCMHLCMNAVYICVPPYTCGGPKTSSSKSPLPLLLRGDLSSCPFFSLLYQAHWPASSRTGSCLPPIYHAGTIHADSSASSSVSALESRSQVLRLEFPSAWQI